MRTNYKPTEKRRLTVWLAVLALLMCPVTAMAQGIEPAGVQEISGAVRTSDLGFEIRIKLTGNTVLTVDCDTYLREITGGKYNLGICKSFSISYLHLKR